MTHYSVADIRNHIDLSFLFKSKTASAEAPTFASAESPLDVAYGRYCEQVNAGEYVDIDTFCDGFPDIQTQLRAQIAIHHEVVDDPSIVRQLFEMYWPEPGDELMGFRIVDRLGEGAFSRVYLAEDKSLGERLVAIKVCWNGAHEAWILGRLEHPNIVPVYSVCTHADSRVSLICMAYLGSTTLKDVLGALWSGGHIPNGARDILNSQGGKDKPGYRHPLVRETPGILKTGSYQEGCAYLALKIAEALAYAHEKGVLHLDLKPSNVLVDASGCPRLLDFNLATASSRGAPRMGGTPAYMSPEQALCFIGLADPASLDERSDIYSLGVMLYELLCGQLPPECSSRALATQDGSSVTPQQTPVKLVPRWQAHTVCKSLREIVDRCLAVERDDRFASMADLVKSLRRELSLNRRIEHWLAIRRRSVTATAGVALLCLTGIAAGLAYRAPYDVREYQRGLDCLTSEQHQQAIEHFTCSLEHCPDNPDVYHARARSYVATGDFHSAIRDLVAADRRRRTGVQCALLGYCCSCIQEPGEAVSWYDRAISLGNTDPAVYLNLGFAHHLRGRYDSAFIALNKALASGVDRGVVLRNRAIIHYTMAVSDNRDPLEARSDIEAAVLNGQASGHTYFRAAEVYAYSSSFDTKWREQALHYIERALQCGIPSELFKSNKYLKTIFVASSLSTRAWPKTYEQVDLYADCFLCPVL